MVLTDEFFLRRTWPLIPGLLRDVLCMFVILSILTLAIWKLVELVS